MSVETDAILRRYFAKQNAPSIETNLLNSIGSDPVLDDNQFSARHNTGLGIANEGIGNFVNTIRNIGNRDKQAVAARNKLAGENYDRLITSEQGRLDNVFKQQEFEANQANNLADRLSREKIAASNNKTPTHDLNELKYKQLKAAEEKRKRIEDFSNVLLQNGIGPKEVGKMRALAVENGFKSSDVGDIQDFYTDQFNTYLGDESKYTDQQTTFNQRANTQFENAVIKPGDKARSDLLRANNINEETVKTFTNPENNIQQGQLPNVVKELVGTEGTDEDGGKPGIAGFNSNNYEEVLGLAEYLYDKSGGLGIDVNLLKDVAILASKKGYFGKKNVLTDKGKKEIDEKLADRGYGNSARAVAVRESVQEYLNMGDDMQAQRAAFEAQLKQIQDNFKKDRQGLSVNFNMGRSDVAPQGIGLFADHPLAQQYVVPEYEQVQEFDKQTTDEAKKKIIEESQKQTEKEIKNNVSKPERKKFGRVGLSKKLLSPEEKAEIEKKRAIAAQEERIRRAIDARKITQSRMQ